MASLESKLMASINRENEPTLFQGNSKNNQRNYHTVTQVDVFKNVFEKMIYNWEKLQTTRHTAVREWIPHMWYM